MNTKVFQHILKTSTASQVFDVLGSQKYKQQIDTEIKRLDSIMLKFFGHPDRKKYLDEDKLPGFEVSVSSDFNDSNLEIDFHTPHWHLHQDMKDFSLYEKWEKELQELFPEYDTTIDTDIGCEVYLLLNLKWK